MTNKSKIGKKKVAIGNKKSRLHRKASRRARVNLSAQMTNYLLEPHPEFGV
jgi:ribosomal protein L28